MDIFEKLNKPGHQVLSPEESIEIVNDLKAKFSGHSFHINSTPFLKSPVKGLFTLEEIKFFDTGQVTGLGGGKFRYHVIAVGTFKRSGIMGMFSDEERMFFGVSVGSVNTFDSQVNPTDNYVSFFPNGIDFGREFVNVYNIVNGHTPKSALNSKEWSLA